MWQVVTVFHLDPQLTSLFFYLSLTTCHLDFVVEFLWKYCVGSTTIKIFNFIRKKKMFQNFAYLLKINKSSLRDFDLLCHWQQNEAIFPYTFLVHKQKNYITVATNRSVSTSVILSSFSLSLILHFTFS